MKLIIMKRCKAHATLLVFLFTLLAISVASAGGILNNGIYGINIDIYSAPYSTTYAELGYGVGSQVVYGPYGCGWFASARVNELTGKNVGLHNGVGWWDEAESEGFTKDTATPTGKALICYKKEVSDDGVEFAHVEVLEAFVDDCVIISTGGALDAPNNGYCSLVIKEASSYLSKPNIQGFVYLDGDHVPNGAVDECTSSNGTFRIRGWGYDKDTLNQSVSIHIYIGQPTSEDHTNADFIISKANKYRSDLNDGGNYTGYYGFDETFTVPADKYGNQTFYVYVLNTTSGKPFYTIPSFEVALAPPEMSQGYDRLIPDGNYIIAACANPLYYLDIEGSQLPAPNNKNVEIWSTSSLDDIGDHDVWTVTYNSNTKFYTIKQKGTDMCLDVQGNGFTDGDNVQVYSSNGPYANPKTFNWAISKKGSKGYRVQSRIRGSSLDISTGLGEGVNVRQWKNTTSDDEGWLFIPYKPSQPIDEGQYVILYTATQNNVIDLPGDTGELENNTRIIIGSDTGDNQYNTYALTKLDNGYYKIKHIESGKCLDVRGGSTTYDSQVSLYDDNGGIAQQWAIVQDGAGYNLISRCNGYALELSSGDTTSGTYINVSPKSSNNYQRWSFAQATHTVSYDVNGGTGTIAEQVKYYNTPLVLSDSIPTRDGHEFSGWGISASATTPAYQPGSQYTLDADITLYALWDVAGAVAQGTCGDSITWLLDDAGKLTISGTGSMQGDHAWSYGWEEYRDQIYTIEIENGITSIGDWAFWGEENLTSVTIATSVTTIGNYAFDCCHSLLSIQLPDTVTSIGDCSFRYCSALSSVNLPRNLISIGDFAFMFCPDAVVSIPAGIQMNQHVRVYEGSLCSLSLPTTINEIGMGAFLCTNIPVNLNINPDFCLPDSLHTIESEAFTGISATFIYIPENRNGKTIIGDRAFANCSQLQYVWISDCSEIEIAGTAFSGCGSNLVIIDDAESVGDTIYEYAVDHGIDWICNEYYAGDG